MKARPSRPTRSVSPTVRPRTPQRAGRRAPRRNPRTSQLLAVGALVLVLAVIAGVVIFTQRNPTSSGGASLTAALPDEAVGHFRGSASAPVTVTEWSDFQ